MGGPEREGAGREDASTPEAPVERWRLAPQERRLAGLMSEFRRRQRLRPDLVVRSWWTPAREGDASPRFGFVLEYCPRGSVSVELAVRGDRVTVEGPAGTREVPLFLCDGWRIGDQDAGSPETLANHLLRLADRALDEAD